MSLKKVLYRTRVRITDSWKKAFMMHPLLRVVFISLLAAQATPNTVWAQLEAVPPLSGVIGKSSQLRPVPSTFRRVQEWST